MALGLEGGVLRSVNLPNQWSWRFDVRLQLISQSFSRDNVAGVTQADGKIVSTGDAGLFNWKRFKSACTSSTGTSS